MSVGELSPLTRRERVLDEVVRRIWSRPGQRQWALKNWPAIIALIARRAASEAEALEEMRRLVPGYEPWDDRRYSAALDKAHARHGVPRYVQPDEIPPHKVYDCRAEFRRIMAAG